MVVDDWKITAPKTKDAAGIVRKLKLSGSLLIVVGQDELDVERSFANLPQVQTTTFGELSAHDVLRADWLVFSDRTLPARRLGLLRDARGGDAGWTRPPRPRPARGLPRGSDEEADPMRDAMSVLIRPVVSEKSYSLMDRSVYVFIVDPRATKIEVRHAVEQAFSVRVTKVNTLNRKGKATRNRRTNVKGKRPDTKRAIVTLHPDDSIDLFAS